jgi:type IV fimbrial biogenesis protein FimT
LVAVETEATMRRGIASHPERGLTLIDLLITVAMAGVLAGVGLQWLIDARNRHVAEVLSWQLASDLQLARSEAVTRHEGVRMSFYAGAGGRCYIVHTGERDDCRCDGSAVAVCRNGALALRSVYQPVGQGAQLAATVDTIQFDARHGTALAGGTACVVPLGDLPIRYTVKSTGRVANCKLPASGSPCSPCPGA